MATDEPATWLDGERTGETNENRGIAAFAYLFGPLTGLLVLARTKGGTARFHAAQSVALGGVAAVGASLLGVLGVAAALAAPTLAPLVGTLTAAWTLACLGGWVGALAGAVRGRRTRLPVAGALAARVEQ